MEGKIWQEILCPVSGGGCGGFILVKLNSVLNYAVIVVCPKCGHEHTRFIKNGHVVEQGRSFDTKNLERIRPTIGAWSEKPRTVIFSGSGAMERDGVIIKDQKDFARPPETATPVEIESMMIRELWEERHAGDRI